MWRMNSVDFNQTVKLNDISSMSPAAIFQSWLDRIRQYYLLPAKAMDNGQNGFASLVLQLCAIDAASSFVINASNTEQKIRTFSKSMISDSQAFEISQDPNFCAMNENEIEEATEHLYFQYRCGLVHNGFTLQVGEFARNNEPDHIFLISYEKDLPISTTHLNDGKKAFIVNPEKFRTMLQFSFTALQNKPSIEKVAIGENIRQALAEEIRIAAMLERLRP